MTSLIQYVVLYILLMIPILFLSFLKLYERFETMETSEEKDIRNFMTLLSESLCPTILTVLEDEIRTNSIQGTNEEKQKLAYEILTKQAGGPLFACPVPNDPLGIPANINWQFQIAEPFNSKM